MLKCDNLFSLFGACARRLLGIEAAKMLQTFSGVHLNVLYRSLAWSISISLKAIWKTFPVLY